MINRETHTPRDAPLSVPSAVGPITPNTEPVATDSSGENQTGGPLRRALFHQAGFLSPSIDDRTACALTEFHS